MIGELLEIENGVDCLLQRERERERWLMAWVYNLNKIKTSDKRVTNRLPFCKSQHECKLPSEKCPGNLVNSGI